MKNLVKQVIQIQYETHDEEMLKKIFTKEVQQNLEEYYPGFFKHEKIYFVKPNYIKSLRYYEYKREWGVSVEIQEGFFGDSFWVIINMVKADRENYVISFIAVDA